MSEKVFPASKQTTSTTTNGAAPPPPPVSAAKAHLLNPTARLPYRQPHNRNHHRPRPNCCCCLCFWAVMIILILTLNAAIAGAVVYINYHPHRPAFTVGALRINRLKLTSSAAEASSSSHLSTLFNLTLSSKNTNSRISYSYDPFAVSVVSAGNGVVLGGGTLPAFLSSRKNETTFRGVTLSATSDLDADSVNKLRSDLKQNTGSIGLKIQMDTKVEVKMGKLNSKKVGIRVVCDVIKGVVPKSKTPAAADVSAASCKVDLRIKIWKWTF